MQVVYPSLRTFQATTLKSYTKDHLRLGTLFCRSKHSLLSHLARAEVSKLIWQFVLLLVLCLF